MLSRKAVCALHALLVLAEAPPERALTAAAIARARHLPRAFLEQVLVELKHRGLVTSLRGPQGGYRLLRAPGEIHLGEVIRTIDGPLAPLPCLSRIAYGRCAQCPTEALCGIRPALGRAHRAGTDALDTITLADALDPDGQDAGTRD